jgi:dolichyl-phosphate-mannose-protein mannosyltransferase
MDGHAVSLRTLRPIDVVAGILIVAGLALRTHDFAFPGHFLFDEHHFVENARNYLSARPDWNDHPPLGKLLIALSIRAFGDQSTAWRTPALVSGLASIGMAAWAIRRMFDDRRAGLLAAALLSADGFFSTYSRLGVLDIHLVACGAAALLISTMRWRPLVAALAGLILGAACTIKFSGVAFVPIFAAALMLEPALTTKARVALMAQIVTVAAAVYFGVFAFGLHLAGQLTGVQPVINETLRLLSHHAALTDMKHPLTSSWPTWFLPVRPITIGIFSVGGSVRVMTTLGNLAVWWSAVFLTLWLAVVVAWRGLRETVHATVRDSWRPEAFLQAHGRRVLLLIGAAFSFIAPWMLSRRDSYIYHFLPAYFFLTLLLAAYVGWVAKHRSTAALTSLVVVLVVFAFFAPVWSFVPIPQQALEWRLIWPGWR